MDRLRPGGLGEASASLTRITICNQRICTDVLGSQFKDAKSFAAISKSWRTNVCTARLR
jgi:hypothetical protein